MTRRDFLGLDWRGDGVVGLGLGLGIQLELGLAVGSEFDLLVNLEIVGDGDGELDLEKKEVIWRCGLTSGDLPLFWRLPGAILTLLRDREKYFFNRTRNESRIKRTYAFFASFNASAFSFNFNRLEATRCRWRECFEENPGNYRQFHTIWREFGAMVCDQ